MNACVVGCPSLAAGCWLRTAGCRSGFATALQVFEGPTPLAALPTPFYGLSYMEVHLVQGTETQSEHHIFHVAVHHEAPFAHNVLQVLQALNEAPLVRGVLDVTPPLRLDDPYQVGWCVCDLPNAPKPIPDDHVYVAALAALAAFSQPRVPRSRPEVFHEVRMGMFHVGTLPEDSRLLDLPMLDKYGRPKPAALHGASPPTRYGMHVLCLFTAEFLTSLTAPPLTHSDQHHMLLVPHAVSQSQSHPHSLHPVHPVDSVVASHHAMHTPPGSPPRTPPSP